MVVRFGGFAPLRIGPTLTRQSRLGRPPELFEVRDNLLIVDPVQEGGEGGLQRTAFRLLGLLHEIP